MGIATHVYNCTVAVVASTSALARLRPPRGGVLLLFFASTINCHKFIPTFVSKE